MNITQSLELYAKGRDAWNAWADKMRKEREELERRGLPTVNAVGPKEREAVKDWLDRALTDFTGHDFIEFADFSGYRFPGEVRFSGATFHLKADFRKADFASHAYFSSVHFLETSRFSDARVFGEAIYENTTFSSDVEFEGTRFLSHARFGHVTFQGASGFEKSQFQKNAGFLKCRFTGLAQFGNSLFKGATWFTGATFKETATFNDVGFYGHTHFADVAFFHWVTFSKSCFNGPVGFSDATFGSIAEFRKVTFYESVRFDLAHFMNYTNFDSARFEKAATFTAIRCMSVFSLASARFSQTPSFIQAHFEEAPRLDDMEIKSQQQSCSFEELKHHFRSDPDEAARWRALKRLAIQGHDHAREQEFFKREIIARRFMPDHPLTAVFWVGIFYQAFSDFGMSIARPLTWLVFSVAYFALIYLSLSPQVPGTIMDIEKPPPCCVGNGDARMAALYVSLSSTPLAPTVRRSKIEDSFVCLYGLQSTGLELDKPVIPNIVSILGILQFLISSALLFLFLLAIRSHFRIR